MGVGGEAGGPLLDAAHAASSLAVMSDLAPAQAFLEAYAAVATSPCDAFWLVMDAVGYLPRPGKPPMFGGADRLGRLDDWLDLVVRRLS